MTLARGLVKLLSQSDGPVANDHGNLTDFGIDLDTISRQQPKCYKITIDGQPIMTDEIDTLRSSEDSLRAKLAEVQLQLHRLIHFETEYEATTKTSSPSVVARIAKMERQKKEMLIELGKLVYARISLIKNKKRAP